MGHKSYLRLILTRSPDSINMCMLVFLLTTAFCPPRTGVGGSRRQLWGGRRGSGAGAAGFLSIKWNENQWKQTHWDAASPKATVSFWWRASSTKYCALGCGGFSPLTMRHRRDDQVADQSFRGGERTSKLKSTARGCSLWLLKTNAKESFLEHPRSKIQKKFTNRYLKIFGGLRLCLVRTRSIYLKSTLTWTE